MILRHAVFGGCHFPSRKARARGQAKLSWQTASCTGAGAAPTKPGAKLQEGMYRGSRRLNHIDHHGGAWNYTQNSTIIQE